MVESVVNNVSGGFITEIKLILFEASAISSILD